MCAAVDDQIPGGISLLASYLVNCLSDFTKYITLMQSGTKMNSLHFELRWQSRTD